MKQSDIERKIVKHRGEVQPLARAIEQRREFLEAEEELKAKLEAARKALRPLFDGSVSKLTEHSEVVLAADSDKEESLVAQVRQTKSKQYHAGKKAESVTDTTVRILYRYNADGIVLTRDEHESTLDEDGRSGIKTSAHLVSIGENTAHGRYLHEREVGLDAIIDTAALLKEAISDPQLNPWAHIGPQPEPQA